MPTVDVLNQNREKVDSLELRDDVFNVKVNHPLVHQVLKAQAAGRRRGTAKVKTRAEVRGGGKKPFRQKGTGNARQGSSRSPIQVGGGQVFGPEPRSYQQKTPKKMMRGALRSVLSDRLQSERFLVLDDLQLEEAKTRNLDRVLKTNFELNNVLLVDDENPSLERSSSNIPDVKFLETEGLNPYDVVRHEWVVLSKRAVDAVQNRLAQEEVSQANS